MTRPRPSQPAPPRPALRRPPSGRRSGARWLALLLVVALALVMAGCDSGAATGARGRSGGDQAPRASRSGVATGTAQTPRAQRERGVSTCRPGQAPRPATGKRALPALVLPCLGAGPDVDLSRLRGPLVINLFAQWCGPCRRELPYYQQLHRRAGDRVAVLGIDYLDTHPGAASALAGQAGVTYPLLADREGRLRSVFGVRALPGLVLVDSHGRVRQVRFQAFDSYADLRAVVGDGLGVGLPR